jgi:hypothetical protein
MRKLSFFLILIFLTAAGVFSQEKNGEKVEISGSVKWDLALINAQVSLDLKTSDVKLPAGRTYGEALLKDAYLIKTRPFLLTLQYDSSSTLGDLVERGELTLADIDAFALSAISKAPSLSPDMRRITSSHTISLLQISNATLRHSRPSPVSRILNPVSSAQYTGIIIIATEELPVHGMKSKTYAVPCIFPKIWDSEMNLIFERNMLEINNTAMVCYSSADNIFKRDNPSGLTKDLQHIVGEKPLRIFALGVFGSKPTDLIIDRNDALIIISSEENRRLLSQGRVVFIMDDAVLENKIP